MYGLVYMQSIKDIQPLTKYDEHLHTSAVVELNEYLYVN